MLTWLPRCRLGWALIAGRTFTRNTNDGFCVSFHLEQSNHLLDKGMLLGL
jgi:hypothetical protein